MLRKDGTRFILATIMGYLVFCSLAYANGPVYNQILRNKPDIEISFAKKLTQTIQQVNKEYNFKLNLIAAMLMQESSYQLFAKNCRVGLIWKGTTYDEYFKAPFLINNPNVILNVIKNDYPKVCEDFGIGQINHRTIKSYNFETFKLTHDLQYSIESMFKVLAYFKKTYSKKEQDWWTRYNASSSIHRQVYLTKVSKYL